MAGPRKPAVTRTVDLVIVGAHPAAQAATIAAIRDGGRVLVVIRSERRRFAKGLRRSVRLAAAIRPRQLSVLTGAEVVCVDGVHAVEAVIIRRIRTGALIAVNASDILVFTGSKPQPVCSRTSARSFKNGGRSVQSSGRPRLLLCARCRDARATQKD